MGSLLSLSDFFSRAWGIFLKLCSFEDVSSNYKFYVSDAAQFSHKSCNSIRGTASSFAYEYAPTRTADVVTASFTTGEYFLKHVPICSTAAPVVIVAVTNATAAAYVRAKTVDERPSAF